MKKHLLFVVLIAILATFGSCKPQPKGEEVTELMQAAHKQGCNLGMWSTMKAKSYDDLMERRLQDSIWWVTEVTDYVPGDPITELSLTCFLQGWDAGNYSIRNRTNETWEEMTKRDSLVFFNKVVVKIRKGESRKNWKLNNRWTGTN